MTAGDSPFAAALRPLAETFRQRAVRIHPVSQVSLDIRNKKNASAYREMQQSVLTWMANPRRAGRLPADAWQGLSFKLDDIGMQPTEVVSIDGLRYWAARIDVADTAVAQRVWPTEIAIRENDDGTVLFGCRVQCVTRGNNVPFERTIPVFVRDIAETQSAVLDGRTVSLNPWLIDNEQAVDELVVLLEDPKRRSDVVVLSLPEDSEDPSATIVSATEIATRTVGAAHVAIITSQASFYLSDKLGREFSVYRQAVRTYRPGFDPTRDEPFVHPLGLPERIAEWADGGAPAYERFLIGQTLMRSVSGQELERKLPPFAEVRRVASELRRQAARDEGSSHEDLLTLAENEIDELQDALKAKQEEYDGLLDLAEQERDEAQNAARQAHAVNMHLRHRIDSLQQQIREAGQSTTPAIPHDLEDFEDWCRINLSGSVELHNRAFQGVKKSVFEDPALIYQALLLLRDEYVPMRRQGGSKRAFEDACRELGIEEQPTFSGSRWGEQGDTYRIRYEGRPVLLDRHLKKGNSRDQRHCFRLYFFWDEANEQVVVGWLPSHLETRIT